MSRQFDSASIAGSLAVLMQQIRNLICWHKGVKLILSDIAVSPLSIVKNKKRKENLSLILCCPALQQQNILFSAYILLFELDFTLPEDFLDSLLIMPINNFPLWTRRILCGSRRDVAKSQRGASQLQRMRERERSLNRFLPFEKE